MDVDTLLSIRVRELRKARKLTLGQLAEASGVSRSMISLIERQETSPTATVLNKLADALGVTLPGLFAESAASAPVKSPLARRAAQPIWTDPASGYVRRHLSPSGYGSPIELVEVCFPPGETVAFENPARSLVIHQQVWVLEGEMRISVGDQSWHLQTGDCLAIELGDHIVFHNPAPAPARYALALTTSAQPPRKSQ